MGNFKWYRKLKGGIWVQYDNCGHGSCCGDSWFQITEQQVAQHEKDIRVIKIEKITKKC